MITPASDANGLVSAQAGESQAAEAAPLSGFPGRWLGRASLLVGGAWLIRDGLHLPLASVVSLSAAAGAWWLLARRRPRAVAVLPPTSAGLLERCEQLLDQFTRLDDATVEAGGSLLRDARVNAAVVAAEGRRAELERQRQRLARTDLEMTLVGVAPPPATLQPPMLEALRSALPLQLHWGHPLPPASGDWLWPQRFADCDGVLYHLRAPLRALDLRWLETLPSGQPLWLLAELGPGADLQDPTGQRELEQMRAQLPAVLQERLLGWDGQAASLAQVLVPVRRQFRREGPQRLALTQRRCLEDLHRRWQGELEGLRRQQFQQLLQRTQWLVAAGVVAAPLPSLDLLVVAVANGLMLQEMARLWGCPWSLVQLREAALELARAALALGVAEWSTQALASLLRLHGATWLVGGALQALSAAYLTRVVGQAMADVMALSAGVALPDLEAIKRQAPLLVARAAESEQLDWSAFLGQARRWLAQQNPPASLAQG